MLWVHIGICLADSLPTTYVFMDNYRKLSLIIIKYPPYLFHWDKHKQLCFFHHHLCIYTSWLTYYKTSATEGIIYWIFLYNVLIYNMSIWVCSIWTASSEFGTYRAKRIWYLSSMRAAKVQASLRIRAVSPEPPLLAHTSSESRGTFRQKARSLAPLNGWACAVKICHDGMLEDTNSLDGAHIVLYGSITSLQHFGLLMMCCVHVFLLYRMQSRKRQTVLAVIHKWLSCKGDFCHICFSMTGYWSPTSHPFVHTSMSALCPP